MIRRILLALFPIAFAVSLWAQNAPQPQSQPSAPIAVTTPMERPGPPPANASPSELEATGDELRAHNLLADAVDYYQAAIKRGGSTVTLHNKVGIAELQATQLDKARKEFEQCVKLDATYPDGYNNLGATWYAKASHGRKSINERDVKKAIGYYEHALTLRDDNATYHSNLGTAYFARKEYEKANAEYARALELDPEVFERRSKSGVSLMMLSQEDRAKFNFYLARLYAKQGNFDSALESLRKAMEDGYPKMADVYSDTNFEKLRKDPRFEQLMAAKPTAIPQ